MINKRSLLFILSLILVTDYLLIATSLNAQVAGKITKVVGRVDILRVGMVRAEPVRVGDTVSIGDILRTKSDGNVEIEFVDNSLMKVGPRSRLGIDEYLYKLEEDKRQASLKLYRGRTGFIVPKAIYSGSGSKFEMKTRTAVAGVRGTEGVLITDGIERVYVKDGVIEFSNPLGRVEVVAGEVGEIFFGGLPQKRPFTEMEYQLQEEVISPGSMMVLNAESLRGWLSTTLDPLSRSKTMGSITLPAESMARARALSFFSSSLKMTSNIIISHD